MPVQSTKLGSNSTYLDLSYLHQISDGDIAFEREILIIYLREVPALAHRIQKKMKTKEYDDAAELVHEMKSKIRALGVKQAWRLADFIELNLRNKTNLSVLPHKISAFFKIIRKSIFLAKKELLKRTE